MFSCCKRKQELSGLKIDKSPGARIDKYREGCGNVSVHPATLDNCGCRTNVVTKVTRCADKSAVARLLKCAQIHKSLEDHEAIIKIYASFSKGNDFILVIEKADGTLRDITRPETSEQKTLKNDVLDNITTKELTRKFFKGVSYIHSNVDECHNIVAHRDIKPSNVLLKKQAREGTYAVKLSDFDSAKEMVQDEFSNFSSWAATEAYMAPELIKLRTPGSQKDAVDYVMADVYSSALVACELLDISGLSDCLNNVQKKKKNRCMKLEVPELARNLLRTMTQFNPKDRITMREAERHPFFLETDALVSAINTFNDQLSKISEALINEFNASYYMLLDKKWKFYAIKSIYKNTKYSCSLDSYFRYCRNLLLHRNKNEKQLIEHFGHLPTTKELLNGILQKTPLFLLHLYWFARKNMAHLCFAQNFPENCVKSYEEQMEMKKQEISNLTTLYLDVHEEGASTTFVTEDAIVEVFESSLNEIFGVLAKTEDEFRAFSVELKRMKQLKLREERKLKRIQKKLMHAPEDYDAREELKRLKSTINHLNERIEKSGWVLEAREVLRHPKNFVSSSGTRLEVGTMKEEDDIHKGEASNNEILSLEESSDAGSLLSLCSISWLFSEKESSV